MTSLPPEETVPEADLEPASQPIEASAARRWSGRLRLLVPTPAVDLRSAVDRLRDAPPRDGVRSWLVTVALTVLAFCIRFVGIGYP
ncbi:MAG: hypothetical protein ACYCV4_19470, partial [Dermatophilaceae bacterium]